MVLFAGPPRGASDVCERLRLAVEQWDWSEICNGLRVTISIGVAGTLSAKSPKEVLEIADQNLYTGKRSAATGSRRNALTTGGRPPRRPFSKNSSIFFHSCLMKRRCISRFSQEMTQTSRLD